MPEVDLEVEVHPGAGVHPEVGVDLGVEEVSFQLEVEQVEVGAVQVQEVEGVEQVL